MDHYLHVQQWKNPRATGISFAVITAFIFAARYVNVLRYTFKGLYILLGSKSFTAHTEMMSLDLTVISNRRG